MSEYLYNNQSNTALVTGASRGIGLAVARELAKCGFKLIITCKNDTKGLDNAAEIIKETGTPCMKFFGDMGNYDDVERLFKQIEANDVFEMPSVLVNNAGVSMVGLFRTCLLTNGTKSYQATLQVFTTAAILHCLP